MIFSDTNIKILTKVQAQELYKWGDEKNKIALEKGKIIGIRLDDKTLFVVGDGETSISKLKPLNGIDLNNSLVIGTNNENKGNTNLIIGTNNKNTGNNNILVGSSNEITDKASNAQAFGEGNIVSGNCSYAEGNDTKASGECSHAEGISCEASGTGSHAEGSMTTASKAGSHAEGVSTAASGPGSHAEGYKTTASGAYSHAEGIGTNTMNNAEFACGKYNNSTEDTLFSIGNGENENNRSNIISVNKNETDILYGNGIRIKQLPGDSRTVIEFLSKNTQNGGYITQLLTPTSEDEKYDFFAANEGYVKTYVNGLKIDRKAEAMLNQVLTWDGTKYTPKDPTGGKSSLSELLDVSISNPVDNGRILTYNTAQQKWVDGVLDQDIVEASIKQYLIDNPLSYNAGNGINIENNTISVQIAPDSCLYTSQVPESKGLDLRIGQGLKNTKKGELQLLEVAIGNGLDYDAGEIYVKTADQMNLGIVNIGESYVNDGGTAYLDLATPTVPGFMSTEDKSKLDAQLANKFTMRITFSDEPNNTYTYDIQGEEKKV